MSSLTSSIKSVGNNLVAEPTIWLRPLLIAGILLFSVALPIAAGHRSRILLVGFFPLAVSSLIFLRQPSLGLVALIVASLIVPLEIGTGSGTSINVTILLLVFLIGLWVLDMVARQRQITLLRSRTFLPLGVFIAVAILSFFVGQLPWFPFARQSAPLSAQLGGLALFILSASAFVLVANVVQELRWLEWMTWAFLALGALFIAGWLIPGLGSITRYLFQDKATGSSSMFWTWLVALSFSQAVFNKKLPYKWRLVLGALAGATLYVGFFLNSDWKSGYLPPLVAVAAIIGLRSWRTGLALLPVVAVGFWYLSTEAVATDQYSTSTRLDAWLIMLEIIKFNPLFGFGPANYYWYTPLFRIRGYYVPFNSHSQYVDIVAQTGLLGLAFFLWFFFEVGRLGWQLRDRVPEGFARAYVYGALGGLAGTLAAAFLVDWVIPFVYNIGFNGFRGSILAWIFLAGLVSLDHIYPRQERIAIP